MYDNYCYCIMVNTVKSLKQIYFYIDIILFNNIIIIVEVQNHFRASSNYINNRTKFLIHIISLFLCEIISMVNTSWSYISFSAQSGLVWFFCSSAIFTLIQWNTMTFWNIKLFVDSLFLCFNFFVYLIVISITITEILIHLTHLLIQFLF